MENGKHLAKKVKVEFLPEREETCARRAFASGPAEGRRQACLLSKAPWKERRYNYILHGMEGLYLALNQHGWLRLCHSTIDWRSSKGKSTSSNWSSKGSDATSRSNHHLSRHHLGKYQCQNYVASITIWNCTSLENEHHLELRVAHSWCELVTWHWSSLKYIELNSIHSGQLRK